MLCAEQVGCGDERHVVVEASIGAALVVAQAEGLFHLAVVGLDALAARRVPDQDGERGVRGQVGDPGPEDVPAALALPLDQQGALGQEPVGAGRDVLALEIPEMCTGTATNQPERAV